MESLKVISSLEIPIEKISYNKKSNVFSVKIFDFMFVGNYKKSIRISKILDDIYASLADVQLNRDDLYFLDFNKNKIHGNTKLKNLSILDKKKLEKEKKKSVKTRKGKSKSKPMKKQKERKADVYETEEEISYVGDDDLYSVSSEFDETIMKDLKDNSFDSEEAEYFEKEVKEVKEDKSSRRDEAPKMREGMKKKEKSSSAPPPPAPGGGPTAGSAGPSAPAKAPAPASMPPPPPSDGLGGPSLPSPMAPAPASVTTAPEEPQPTVYEINMGLQYYSVMMEQRSYLFYVYFSHEELKIVDEEGKVVYETTIRIVTTKKEPPVLDLRIEGEGFEVHPLFGKVEVKKDAINPPVMIFSILPLKSTKKKKKKKETERRFLNAYIDFEGKTISHTILSIIVQPKFFRVDIGPIHLNLSKKTATVISFISILIAGISLIYTLFSLSPSSSFTDILGGFAPGLGSIIFFAIFLFTLLKEGIFPLKQKISGFLNFDQAGVLIK